MNLPLGRPGHWRVLPQLDPRGRGELARSHTATSPCAACEALATIVPPPPPPPPSGGPVAPPRRALALVAPTPPAVEAPVEWVRRLAHWEVILVALESLGPRFHTVAEVVLAAWQLDPQRFGLGTHRDEHPDSRTVIAKLSGIHGVVGRGWARRSASGTLTVTAEGARYVAALRGGR